MTKETIIIIEDAMRLGIEIGQRTAMHSIKADKEWLSVKAICELLEDKKSSLSEISERIIHKAVENDLAKFVMEN